MALRPASMNLLLSERQAEVQHHFLSRQGRGLQDAHNQAVTVAQYQTSAWETLTACAFLVGLSVSERRADSRQDPGAVIPETGWATSMSTRI